MEFRIADTFTGSLARLTGDEQKAVKTTAFDLQLNPANPGMSFHKLAKAKDKRFWSVRVGSDLRLIVHRTADSLLLCYVDHHDKAYAWAERRKLETHPTTGAAQLVEIRERVQEITLPTYVQQPQTVATKKPLLAHVPDEELLGYGVPVEWLADVRQATEDTVLGLADHLPAEAAEALLELATGGTPHKPRPALPAAGPFDHPDARRRFRVVTDVDELARALEYPWERWTVFLHPAQRELVERRFGGPARIAGSAGTGKTVVALHRAAHLARANPDARILLTTFSETLASALRTKLVRLIGTEPRLRERIDVDALDAVARRLYDRLLGRAEVASREVMRDLVREVALESVDQKFSLPFLLSEWREVVDAWQIDSWEAYRDVARLGRKTRLPEKQRQALWAIFERVRAGLNERRLVTQADLYSRLAGHLAAGERLPYDFVIVDEAQDVSVAQLRFVAALGGGRPDALFFAGDLGQRIFQLPFSWRSLGVDIRGRSGTLRINYRTSHQIRAQADRLLGKHVTDVDGNTEDRGGAISVFNGADPVIRVLDSAEEESTMVGRWLAERALEGVTPGEMAVFVRSPAELPRARAAVETAGLLAALLDDDVKTVRDHVSVGTMHLSKGLEFRSVAVMACDDEVLPLQARIEAVTDEGDLEEVYDTERHLLYVVCTRARDHLLVTGVNPASEFLEDLRG
ncbi:MAG: UvrD-helicase domain-containing protein [Candidatus Rokubacteria bacterium]|nr:UvrD-helicase domain-containing protein [Candidatus Rokubacteria bacterium]